MFAVILSGWVGRHASEDRPCFVRTGGGFMRFSHLSRALAVAALIGLSLTMVLPANAQFWDWGRRRPGGACPTPGCARKMPVLGGGPARVGRSRSETGGPPTPATTSRGTA